jgi:heterodisulfide reductase subunit D
MTEANSGTLFLEALQGRVDDTLDACTRCGKCVEACPMVEPAGLDKANAVAIVEGTLDLIAGGSGTKDAERWAQVCTNRGRCMPACDYGVNPRFMVNMARIASKAKLGDAEVRRAAHTYFNTMGRGTRIISRLQLAPEVIAKINPPLRAPEEYTATPDIVFYTGCNVIKTPHIALLVLEVLDAIGVSYEVMGGTATCCGIQQFKQGDAKTAGRVAYNTIERLARPGASRVIAWCPSCHIQIGEVALPAYEKSFDKIPFDIAPIAEFLAERLDRLRPLFAHPVRKRVALQERAALPGVMTAVKEVLGAIDGLELVELDVEVVSTQASHLSVLPKYKADLRQREFAAAAEAGVTTFASIFHGCHRELVKFQPEVEFELLNFMELIGEAMGIHIPDLYKRLSMIGDVDAIVSDTADLIAVHKLDLDTVRDVLAQDIYGGGRSVPGR